MESTRTRWQKIGGGSFRLANGKIIKPKQIFFATEAQIPKAFRFMVIPVDELPVTPEPKKVESKYSVVKSSVGWYNVVDEAGKAINEKALRKTDADTLLESLK
jgi:hypothetical protein